MGGVQGTPVVWSVCFGVWLVSLPPPPVSASQGRAARLVSLSGARSVRRIGVAVRVCGARQRIRLGRVFGQSSVLLVPAAMAGASSRAESHTFASLVQVAVSVGAADKLEDLRCAGIKSAAQLSAAPRSQLRSILGDIVLDRLLQPAGANAARGHGARGDLPVVHPYARGSMQRISLEGGAGSFDALDDAFLEDRYARTSRAPIESRWKTWQRLCAARSLDPLPMTQEKIFKVGALLKEGKYRSSAQYFSVAKQRHREAEYAWTDALDLAVQQAVRSINRGLGPARLKRDLFVDRAPSDLDAQLHAAYSRLQVPAEHQFAEPCAVLAVATWFLLRGIEVANVRCTDLHLNRGERLVRLSLPVSKTDPAAKGCERSHVCICKPVHDPGCRSGCPPEVMFTQLQTCSCARGRQAAFVSVPRGPPVGHSGSPVPAVVQRDFPVLLFADGTEQTPGRSTGTGRWVLFA